MTRCLSFLALFSMSAILVSAGVARADHGFSTVEDLAFHVQDHSRDLYYEVRNHLGQTSAGRHLMSDVVEVNRAAARIRSYAHAGYNLEVICRDARKLDELIHHMEEIVDDLRHAGHDHYGHDHFGYGQFGHGQFDGRHVASLLREIEEDVHNLQSEIEWLERSAVRPGVSVGPGGIYLGGRGFSIRLAR
ncbi:MAG TPA: hypothetical protein VFV87_13450 [Pirellulaceae bacterium]|nr:hypothetical protein [Pirellulaceae bacterium]